MNVMTRFAHARTACLAVFVGAMALALFASPATGAPSCAQRVIDDWSDNGRIDQIYQLHCYEGALQAIPVDLRDYTNAADIIERALTDAVRQRSSVGIADVGSQAAEVDTSGASALPLPLLILVGVSLTVLAAGAAGYFSRRRRSDLSA
jgi:hypothetical protein